MSSPYEDNERSSLSSKSDQLLYLFSYYKEVEEDRKIKSLFNKMMEPERKQHFVFFLILASAPLQ